MTQLLRCALAVFLCAATLGGAYAQAAAPATAPATVDEASLALTEASPSDAVSGGTSLLPYFLRMVLVLALVIAAIYGLYALLKRSAKSSTSSDALLRVLATTNVAAGRSLHVVALGDKAWLVGSTDSAISLISEIQDKEMIDTLALRAAAMPEAPRREFTSMLVDMLGRKGGRRPAASVPSDFLSRQKDRLKKF